MNSRNVRIAWSVACGIACALLLALWATSYVAQVTAGCRVGGPYVVGFASQWGVLMLAQFDLRQPSGMRQTLKSSNYYCDLDPAEPLPLDQLRWQIHLGYKKLPRRHFITPHWFPALLLALAAYVPWKFDVNWHFSLRTLLIATTVFAITLGALVIRLRGP